MPVPKTTAAMLYAQSQGMECSGNWFCHWCGSPCDNKIAHDDPPPIPFLRSRSTAKRPAEPYVCKGCELWRSSRNTINLLSGGFKDGQLIRQHSWLITDRVALAIFKKEDFEELWRFLIAPSKKFALLLKDPDDKNDNLLQLGIANDLGGILANTPLHFTFQNIPHSYSIYELISSIKSRNEPPDPGVRLLWDHLGSPPEDVIKMYRKVSEPKGRGRPLLDETKLEEIHTVVVGSGEKR